MNIFFSKAIFIFLGLCAVAFRLPLHAIALDDSFDISLLKETRLGYYVGSFDPIHLGHQNVIDESLNSGFVDYVLVYPVPGGDTYKNRSDHALRLKMVATVYYNHPKVLFTDWTPKMLQERLTAAIPQLEVVGIIGSDVVMDTLLGPDKALSEKHRSIFMRGLSLTEKHYNDTVGALMALRANSFLVMLRGEIDLSSLHGKIDDRPVLAFIRSNTYSSTAVRNAIRNRQPFEELLDPRVQEVIRQEGMYGLSQ